MRSRVEQESDLGRIVEVVSRIDGVVGLLLFGSHARDVHEEGSDIDLLVIFESDKSMWRVRRKLYEEIANLGLFTQVLTRSLRELREKTEPTFLENILSQGRWLYLRHPLQVPSKTLALHEVTIITYSLKGLEQGEKTRVNYKLYGKRSQGISGVVTKAGGIRLGGGCFAVSKKREEEIRSVLEEEGVNYQAVRAYFPSGEIAQ